MSAATETPRDVHAGKSTNCRAGNHATCATLKARCRCSCHGPDGQTSPGAASSSAMLPCPDCAQSFASPQGLGAHRSRAHGYRSPVADKQTPPRSSGERPKIVVELVDEEPPPPPPPPAPKLKPAEQIRALVEEATDDGRLVVGEWKRVAVLATGRAAKGMATKLRKTEDGLEWQAADDGRLFVRLAPEAG